MSETPPKSQKTQSTDKTRFCCSVSRDQQNTGGAVGNARVLASVAFPFA